MYYFYLGNVLLPVAPEKIQTKINNANKTYILMNDGEINVLKKAKLTDVEFDVLIPSVRYPFAVYKDGFIESQYFLRYFDMLKTLQQPFQFIVTRALPNGKVLYDTNMKVSLENYTIKESSDNGFDMTVSIKLKMYRDYATKICNVSFTGTKPTGKAPFIVRPIDDTSPESSSNQSYTVVKGDCLWNIAKRFYGNGAKYTVIYDANKGVIGGNPNKIYPGQILTIPAA